MSQDIALPTSLATGNIDAYISSAYQIPVLSVEEEHCLALRLRDHGDMDAAKQLILSHLRFVIRIARGYMGYGLPLPDLIQEGTVGLMKAVRRFEPDMGVRLVSFAVHWIRAEIHEYILRNWRIVKVATTKAQRKLFFNLRSAKKRLGWFTKEEIDAVAADLGVKPATVLEMESRLSNYDVAFDSYDDDDDDSVISAPAAYLPDMRMEPATLLERQDNDDYRQEQLLAALETLDQRSQTILRERWLLNKKQTLHDLAERFGVSAERIRQIEKNAMKKLRSQLQAETSAAA
jgi:RNA polymerase sigma-32 factor